MSSITSSTTNAPPRPVAGVAIPDSKLAREIAELVRDTASPLLFNPSRRVFYRSALTGVRRGLKFDAKPLYTGTMFHDMGLTPQCSSADERFEMDGANAARFFHRLRRARRGAWGARYTRHCAHVLHRAGQLGHGHQT
jgi:hypothetical protein